MALAATESDREVALATLVDAFHRDPLWSWICPDPLRRHEQQGEILGLYVDCALAGGCVWMTDESASAVAVFTQPGERELTDEAEERLEKFVGRALGTHAPEVLETFERFEAAVPEGPPFFYLSFLGTKSECRGHGLGMGLLAELVERADAEGHPTYLESTNPANDARYERLGFSAVGRFSTPDDLHSVTTMWRDPRPGS